MIYSLKVQTSKKWKLHIVVDGNHRLFEDLVEYTNAQIKVSLIDGPNNDWGHTAREFGKQEANGDWIVMSGDDNYYVPTFVEEFLKAGEQFAAEFVYCDMIHNGFDYKNFICSPSAGLLDIGNFMVRTEMAKEIPLGKGYAADGDWIEEFKRRHGTKGIIKVPKILYVHN